MAIGDRIKSERERLNITQSDMGKAANVTKRSQINYEQGVRVPDANYLAAISELGADISYIVTGKQSAKPHMNDKGRLTSAIRAVETGLELINKVMPPDKKAELIMLAYDLMSEPEADAGKVVHFIKMVA